MRPVQKRGFFNFLCAFLPGASEMYMGFTKMGFSMMSVFMISFGLIAFFDLSDLFLVVPFLMWFYGFFHARNLTSCNPELFINIQDDYFWNELVDGKGLKIGSGTVRTIGAWVMILGGMAILWDIVWNPISEYIQEALSMTDNRVAAYILHLLYSLPKLVIAVAIIIVGIRLIMGKKKTLYLTDNSMPINQPVPQEGERKDA
jgi:uncharacterized membrane protein